MSLRGPVLNTIRRYWPIGILLPVAFIIDAVLVAVGDPWSAADWGSNVVFAYVITIATIFLGQRQQRIQEATADAELIGKIGSIRGNLDRAILRCEASAVEQLFIDARAGLHLVPLADPTRRDEYFTTVEIFVKEINDMIVDSVRAYTRWNPSAWAAMLGAAGELRQSAEEIVGTADKVRSPFRMLINRIEEFERNARSVSGVDRQGVPIPYEAFERSFRHGDVNQRVRVLLNWDLLGRLVCNGGASITLYRNWSSELIESHRVFSVWYVNESNSFAGYHEGQVKPVLFKEIDKYFEILPVESREAIDSMARWLEHRPDSSLPKVEIVTMEVGRNDIIVLDGNHRMASLAHSRPRRSRITAITCEYRIRVEIGLNEDLLPDLCHYPQE